MQQLTLRHPAVREKLGLQDMDSQKEAPKMLPLNSPELQEKTSFVTVSDDTSASKTVSTDSSEKWLKISAENLSPRELTNVSG